MQIPKAITALSLIVLTVYIANRPAALGDAPASTSVGSNVAAYYEGPWLTTKNKKLTGTMTCQVTATSNGKWQGRFWGVWQQVPFDYTVNFTADKRAIESISSDAGSGEAVNGTAMIDGADYVWAGLLLPNEFKINFTGSRYEGHAELKRVAARTPPKQSEK